MFAKIPQTVKVIGKNEFIIHHWSPTKAMMNLPKIGRYLAVPISTLAGSAIAGGANFEDALPKAMIYLFNTLEEDGEEQGVMRMINLILENVECNSMGGGIDIDEVFQDDLMGMMTLLGEVLKANYGCFFTKDGFATLPKLLAQFGLVKQLDEMDQEQE